MHTSGYISWRKSSFSADGNNCLELAMTPGAAVHIRESDDPAVVLNTTPARLAALLTLARSQAARC
jgi:hypothetical protein